MQLRQCRHTLSLSALPAAARKSVPFSLCPSCQNSCAILLHFPPTPCLCEKCSTTDDLVSTLLPERLTVSRSLCFLLPSSSSVKRSSSAVEERSQPHPMRSSCFYHLWRREAESEEPVSRIMLKIWECCCPDRMVGIYEYEASVYTWNGTLEVGSSMLY